MKGRVVERETGEWRGGERRAVGGEMMGEDEEFAEKEFQCVVFPR